MAVNYQVGAGVDSLTVYVPLGVDKEVRLGQGSPRQEFFVAVTKGGERMDAQIDLPPSPYASIGAHYLRAYQLMGAERRETVDTLVGIAYSEKVSPMARDKALKKLSELIHLPRGAYFKP